jgi:hypothetical protein
MEVFAEGFVPREINFAVVEKNPTVLNITLTHVSFIITIMELTVWRSFDLSHAKLSNALSLEFVGKLFLKG